jgi:two-component system chemotaxis response regulator CheB
MNVLLVDDSGPFRMMLGRMLAAEAEVSAVWTAVDGREGVEMALRLRPQIILMDLEMPRLDGFGAIDEIMNSDAACPIVVLSSLISDENRVNAVRSFEVGAVEVLAKPRQNSMQAFRTRLMGVMRTMAKAKVVRRKRSGELPSPQPISGLPAHLQPNVSGNLSTTGSGSMGVGGTLSGQVAGGWQQSVAPASGAQAPIPLSVGRQSLPAAGLQALIIGSSTGGPPVLRELLTAMPAPFPVPVLIAQHILAGFDAGLATWLCATGHKVVLATDGMRYAPGLVIVAPGDAHMVVEGDHVRLQPPVDGDMVPSADKLMASAARCWGNGAAGVVLTGMGRDGARGLLQIRQAGGRTLTQRGDTCVVNGMPEAARACGASQEDLSPAELGLALAGLPGPALRRTG